jgi:tripartite-type tricarboxylate transporter receptor subunit TctC
MKRSTFLLAACAATLLSALPAAHAADAFPSKPLTLVIPFPPGGPTDAMARTLAAEMKDRLGQPMIVENRAGAGGNIGAEYVARAEADGHTLMFGTSGPLAINKSLYRKINYDPVKSFAPIIQVGYLPNILVVNPALPVKNVPELVAYAKANPGKLSYASSGNGASSHLAGVLFNSVAGTDLQHIPYKGTGPALNDLLGNQVSMTFTDILTALPYVKAGKLRALGVATARALAGAARRADHFRAGLQGLRRERVLRHRRAGRHARRAHRQAQPCVRGGAQFAEGEADVRLPGSRGAGGYVAAEARAVHCQRVGEVEGRRAEVGRAAGLIRCFRSGRDPADGVPCSANVPRFAPPLFRCARHPIDVIVGQSARTARTAPRILCAGHRVLPAAK